MDISTCVPVHYIYIHVYTYKCIYAHIPHDLAQDALNTTGCSACMTRTPSEGTEGDLKARA